MVDDNVVLLVIGDGVVIVVELVLFSIVILWVDIFGMVGVLRYWVG